jgi:hypothetical protein
MGVYVVINLRYPSLLLGLKLRVMYLFQLFVALDGFTAKSDNRRRRITGMWT